MRKITAVFWIPTDEWDDDGELYAEDVRLVARLADQGAAELAFTENMVLSKEEAQEDEDWTESAQERFFWEEDDDE